MLDLMLEYGLLLTVEYGLISGFFDGRCSVSGSRYKLGTYTFVGDILCASYNYLIKFFIQIIAECIDLTDNLQYTKYRRISPNCPLMHHWEYAIGIAPTSSQR